MAKYAEAAHALRAMMLELTPLVEPVSLDEAYLDLNGTERLHGMAPAKTLAGLANRIEQALRITVSIGLSHNKFLAKLASDLDKPRGFAVIGRTETKFFLREKPVGMIRGVGPVLQARLAKDGFQRIGQIQDSDARALERMYGDTGLWLFALAHGDDTRTVESGRRIQKHLGGDHLRGRHRRRTRARAHSCGSRLNAYRGAPKPPASAA